MQSFPVTSNLDFQLMLKAADQIVTRKRFVLKDLCTACGPHNHSGYSHQRLKHRPFQPGPRGHRIVYHESGVKIESMLLGVEASRHLVDVVP